MLSLRVLRAHAVGAGAEVARAIAAEACEGLAAVVRVAEVGASVAAPSASKPCHLAAPRSALQCRQSCGPPRFARPSTRLLEPKLINAAA